MPIDDPRLQAAVLDHRSLAESVAWRWIKRLPMPVVDADEILSICAEALVTCASRWLGYCQDREFSPWTEDGSRVEGHFAGYVSRTATGRILDFCRTADCLSRVDRRRVKALQAARDAGARTDAEAAVAAGLSAAEASRVLAADQFPVSLDDHGEAAGCSGIAEPGPGTEAQAELHATLAAFLAVFDALPPVSQVLLSLVFHREVTLEVAAKEAHLELAEATRLHDAAILAIHDTLLLAVQDEGTGPYRG